MWEKFMKVINEFKKSKENELMRFDLETVQGFFEMQDHNKWLRFNAITQKQLETADRFEFQLNSIMKKLYVPNYQTENV